MTLPNSTDTNPNERPNLLAYGATLLVLSLFAQMALPGISDGDGDRVRRLVAWGGQVTFWLGIICMGGLVLAEVLRDKSR